MNITLDEYQRKAMNTAIYPDPGLPVGLYYTALGLAGEAGEVANKVKKVIRDNGGVLDGQRRLAISREVGGVLWYCAALANELGYTLGDIAADNLDVLASRAERGVISGSGDNR